MSDDELYTGVIVPVVEADPIVRERNRATRAHVTVLTPFVPRDDVSDGVLDELAGYFSEVTPFALSFTEVCEFPDGLTYLAPEPVQVLRRLTHGLHRLFPEFPPYGGAFDDTVPHLTVPLHPGEDTESLRTALYRLLPLSATATGAELVLGNTERIVETLAVFEFGSAAA